MKTFLIRSITICLMFQIGISAALAQKTQKTGSAETSVSEGKQDLSQLSLDFPGGTPEQLIKQMEKALGKPVNAIIPQELRSTFIPSFSVRNVTAPQLFLAIESASQRIVANPSSRAMTTVNYGFRTPDRNPEDTSIWYFHHSPGPELLATLEPPKVAPQDERVVHFFQLAPYLEYYKVEDITTAITTGQRMLEATGSLALKFHEETKLLIAAGNRQHINVIVEVLNALRREDNPSRSPFSPKSPSHLEQP